jgi:hypothetical protein
MKTRPEESSPQWCCPKLLLLCDKMTSTRYVSAKGSRFPCERLRLAQRTARSLTSQWIDSCFSYMSIQLGGLLRLISKVALGKRISIDSDRVPEVLLSTVVLSPVRHDHPWNFKLIDAHPKPRRPERLLELHLHLRMQIAQHRTLDKLYGMVLAQIGLLVLCRGLLIAGPSRSSEVPRFSTAQVESCGEEREYCDSLTAVMLGQMLRVEQNGLAVYFVVGATLSLSRRYAGLNVALFFAIGSSVG